MLIDRELREDMGMDNQELFFEQMAQQFSSMAATLLRHKNVQSIDSSDVDETYNKAGTRGTSCG